MLRKNLESDRQLLHNMDRRAPLLVAAAGSDWQPNLVHDETDDQRRSYWVMTDSQCAIEIC
jgi:hypothetical protein